MVETKEKLNVPEPTGSKEFAAATAEFVNYGNRSAASNDNTVTTTASNTPVGLSPLVYWAQTEQQITLKVDLRDAKLPLVHIASNNVRFAARGYGARGINNYKFELHLYGRINAEHSNYRITDHNIEFQLKKSEESWWPRLVATPQKPHWLKIDFDRWRSEDEVVDEQPRNVMQDYAKEYEKLQKQEFGYIKESTKKVYMIFYNFAQFIGYLYILSVMGVLYYRDGPACMLNIYEAVGSAMKFCQLLQYLEVLHPIFGYAKGSALMAFFQVSGRNFVLFAMIDMEERMQTKPVVFYVFFVWACVEIVRYPYYITQLLDREMGLLTWLRYTVWIPLYPMGILCEGIIILRNIPYFEETNNLSVHMPNKWNYSFDMPTFLKIYLLLLTLPGTYMVMTHMAQLRAKKLSSHGRKTAAVHVD